MPTLRVLAYCRQSLARQGERTASDSLSLQAQESRYHERCAREHWIDLGVIHDHDLKGTDPTRPGVRELLDRSAAGGVDAIWVFSLSRFARDYLFQELTLRSLKEHGIAHLISETEPWIDDDFTRGIHGLVHAKSIKDQGAFLSMSFARMAENGLWHGSAPYGWQNCGKGIIAPHPEQAPIVAELARRFLAGDRWFALARWLLSQGVQSPRGSATWHDAVIRRTLLNPCHAGYVRTRAGLIPGRHFGEAIISPDDWCRIRHLVEARPTVRHKAIDHWAEGLVEHSCGRRMYLWPTRQGGKTYLSYVCGSQRRPERCGADAASLSTRILDQLARLALASDLAGMLDVAGAVARQEAVAGSASVAKERAKFEREARTLTERRRAIITLFELGKITLPEYDERIGKLDYLLTDNSCKRTNLPAPIDAEQVARTILRVAAARDALRLDLIPDERMREVVEPLGRIVVSPEGVGWRYVAGVAGVLEREPVVVPKSRYGPV